ncbi:MAG: hypothetical protein U0792_04555 [Gemmataceae bacterium]
MATRCPGYSLAHPLIDYINPGGGSLVIAGWTLRVTFTVQKFTYTNEGDINDGRHAPPTRNTSRCASR